jgi:hypothetical protein
MCLIPSANPLLLGHFKELGDKKVKDGRINCIFE